MGGEHRPAPRGGAGGGPAGTHRDRAGAAREVPRPAPRRRGRPGGAPAHDGAPAVAGGGGPARPPRQGGAAAGRRPRAALRRPAQVRPAVLRAGRDGAGGGAGAGGAGAPGGGLHPARPAAHAAGPAGAPEAPLDGSGLPGRDGQHLRGRGPLAGPPAPLAAQRHPHPGRDRTALRGGGGRPAPGHRQPGHDPRRLPRPGGDGGAESGAAVRLPARGAALPPLRDADREDQGGGRATHFCPRCQRLPRSEHS